MESSSRKTKLERRHHKYWEGEDWAKGWLKPISDAPSIYQETCRDQNTSWCFACKVGLRSHKIDLKKHSESQKHKSMMSILYKQNRIEKFVVQPQSNESKIIDIKIAIFIAKHTSIASVDYLSSMLRNSSSKENPFETLRLHKTKCTAIIKNVVSPSILEMLVQDIDNSNYSLIVDESTDISQTKWMSICVRFFSRKQLYVVNQYLGIFLVEEATSIHLFEGLKIFPKKVGLNINNMVAIGTDGASNLCGKNNSLYTLLRKENPLLLIVKCSCHSLHLCCSKAYGNIPKNADFLIKELYNYFSHSPLRTLLYRRAFDLINIGVDSNNFRKLVQVSGTRWLSYGAAIRRILEQWVELKYHFSLISTAENDKNAQMIFNELSDEKNRLFLIFISPMVTKMNQLNLEFQSDHIDVGSMHDQLLSTIQIFSSKIFKPSFLNNFENADSFLLKLNSAIDKSDSFLSLNAIDYGAEFEIELRNADIHSDQIHILKENCFTYLKKLLKEMLSRLPENMKLFKVFQEFSITKCGNPLTQAKFSVIHDTLRQFMSTKVSAGEYELQWTKLCYINWKDYFKDDIPTNLLDFWPNVYNYSDAAGTFHFKEISLAVLNMLVIPTSNACVERVFSIMNYTNTRLRNKVQYELLDALLRIINYMNLKKICCNTFEPSENMLKKFNSSVMYDIQNSTDETDVYNLLATF